ncbi:MAG: hypothetical protein LQ342_001069 [Letrouitia transgressa]|nr:MAG: hypothetical protein LQ342_001069 [Letrouitia transgressa]
MASHHPQAISDNISTLLHQPSWKEWDELQIFVTNLPRDITTGELWSCFTREGHIHKIDIKEDSRGLRNGNATVSFKPPPMKAFWRIRPYFIRLRHGGRAAVELRIDQQLHLFSPSTPQHTQRKSPEVMKMWANSIDFGIMYDQISMMIMHTVKSRAQKKIEFVQNMLHREIVVVFEVDIKDSTTGQPQFRSGPASGCVRTETFRFHIPLARLSKVYVTHEDADWVEFVLSLETPPHFSRKLPEKDTHDEKARFWSENYAWYRQTDIIYSPATLKSSPVALRKSKPIIDIGRWKTYRFSFDKAKNDRIQYLLMWQALRDYNVQVEPLADFKVAPNRESVVWDYIDNRLSMPRTASSALRDLMAADELHPIPFPVRYLLEVCISHGCLSEYNLGRDFVSRLRLMNGCEACNLLEYIANQGKRIFDPMTIFDLQVIKKPASEPQIPHYCTWVRSATVTPSTIYYHVPTVEISNRVIRHYSEHADRFLRVRFTDELLERKIFSTDKDTANEVFTRIKRTMQNGIVIGERHYLFLAFGNSQFREGGAYFFAPLPYLHPQQMRAWMGSFTHIKSIAVYAARLGQCFSTTRAITGTKPEVHEIEDVERNGLVFTDGVGRMSPLLACLVASELGILRTCPEPPSVFQFRLEGCKGVLAVSAAAAPKEISISIRPSQHKFDAVGEVLEIVRWSQLAAANLNRQLIIVLSALGVADSVFLTKQRQQLSSLEKAMTDEKTALGLLQKDIDPNQMTLTLAGMLLDGFQQFQDPFVVSLLRLWRAWSIKCLKEKARILVSQGAFLFGCVDETGQLRGHYRTKSPTEDETSLPQIFVQLSKDLDGNDNPWVVRGPMILARNPSLHPGDIRIVYGVDVAELHHFKDVIVMPQTGDIPLGRMCSGGDLDGDDYLVFWDKELFPSEWNHEPMDYTPPPKMEVRRRITADDLTSYFVTYMKNDNLPTIAHAHLALADFLDEGVKAPKCLQLAALHSMAVDYLKTGVPAQLTRELRPSQWPHFMEKEHQKQYHSRKILGKLYDEVELVGFEPAYTLTFDSRILSAYQLDQSILDDAYEVKKEYDIAVRRIMAQHDIKSDFEVWSTFVLHHSRKMKDFKFHEEIGNLSASLKDRFRSRCYEKAGNDRDIKHFVGAMYTVTAEEVTLAVRERRLLEEEEEIENLTPAKMPFISFPWVFHDLLGKIAKDGQSKADGRKDVSLSLLVDQSDHTSKNNAVLPTHEEQDTSETGHRVTHCGQTLELVGGIGSELDTTEGQPVTPSSGFSEATSDSGSLIDCVVPEGFSELVCNGDDKLYETDSEANEEHEELAVSEEKDADKDDQVNEEDQAIVCITPKSSAFEKLGKLIEL